MAISTREFLVFVAIVTSAIVLEVRQHGTDENLAAVHTQSTHEGLCNPEASALKNGPPHPSCEPANDVQSTGAQPRARVQLWV
ncbi:hypothetical protein SBC1_10080 [Caballeronia sp. SBC1]|uniref:hypothetical protein n=1 Tax=unclassified Caballeronia TaxID=2646786 RepID=UPI0013E1AAA9|nr:MULTISPECIES: hypothetical protein [unclassified Caballeronia]QIE23130.1 hypothetical protein SBC2_11480 [Caballeronia sp. SBC2]QIN61024.1 hypothetical protein SBC1_10080 [Caballeronia sp. SBC1]